MGIFFPQIWTDCVLPDSLKVILLADKKSSGTEFPATEAEVVVSSSMGDSGSFWLVN